jgi:hypothetical protein
MKPNPDKFAAKFNEGVTKEQINTLNARYGVAILQKNYLGTGIYALSVPEGKDVSEMYTVYGDDKADGYGNEPIVQYATPIFFLFDKERQRVLPADHILIDEFSVKFKLDVTEEQIEEFNNQHHVLVVDKYTWFDGTFRYRLKVTRQSSMNALDMANFYHEHSFTEYAHPSILVDALAGGVP